ncbi:MAG: RNA polymerase sigma factor [Candidatus Kapaibacterium sp.]
MNKTEKAGRPSDLDSRSIAEHIGTKQREFLALLMPVLPKLSRFCRAMCRGTHGIDGERAKDLVSETILKAYENFERLREPTAFLSYLFTIAARASRHERIKSARSQPFSETVLENFVDEHNAPDANADVDHLYVALAKLPKKQREAIVMSEITGLKLEEVALVQGSSLSAVKSRVSRGRKKLAKLLGASEWKTESNPQPIANAPSNSQSFHRARFAFEAKEKI